MLRSALFLVAALAASPALAEAQMRIDDNGRGNGGIVARNVGSEVLVVQSGQLNYREDCELAPMTLFWPNGQRSEGLFDKAAQLAKWKEMFGDAGTPAIAPKTVRPGEAIDLELHPSPCSVIGSEVIAILIRTDKGDFTFDAQ